VGITRPGLQMEEAKIQIVCKMAADKSGTEAKTDTILFSKKSSGTAVD